MSRTKVLLVGAAGETGGSIAKGLLENPTFVSDFSSSFLSFSFFSLHFSFRSSLFSFLTNAGGLS